MGTTNIVDFARRDEMTDALTELLKTEAQQRRLPPAGFGVGTRQHARPSSYPSVEGDQVDLVGNHRLTCCSLSRVLPPHFEAWMRQGK
jgi:hypothetical protein